MTKRILRMAIAAVLVLGAAGVALAAATPPRPTLGPEVAALAAAADPDPANPPAPPDPANPSGAAAGKKQELQACVNPKVAAGADKRTARQECATQLGIAAGRAGAKGKVKGLGRAAHAELVVPKKGVEGQWETVVVDRGKVTSVSADSISVERPDGPTVTLKVVAGTKVRGAPSLAQLAPGRAVVVTSVGGEARAVVARG